MEDNPNPNDEEPLDGEPVLVEDSGGRTASACCSQALLPPAGLHRSGVMSVDEPGFLPQACHQRRDER